MRGSFSFLTLQARRFGIEADRWHRIDYIIVASQHNGIFHKSNITVKTVLGSLAGYSAVFVLKLKISKKLKKDAAILNIE